MPRTKKNASTTLPSLISLTPKQHDLLIAIIENGLSLSRTDLAEKAGCDRKTVWSAFQNEEFIDAYNKVCLFLIKERIGEVLDASIKAARTNSFADRQMLLQIVGLYKPISRQEVTGKDGGPMQVATIVGLIQEVRQGVAADRDEVAANHSPMA
jgi:hypothetical protein